MTLIYIIFTVVIICFCVCLMFYATQKESRVEVTYTVWDGSNPTKYVKVFTMKGNEFDTSIDSYKGINVGSVFNKDVMFCYWGSEYKCFYYGTSDVKVNSLKILK